MKLWKNIFNFKGTASTKEFFQSILANIIGMYIIFIPVLLLYAGILLILKQAGMTLDAATGVAVSYAVAAVFTGIFVLPMVSLLVRRIRDSEITWWLPAGLVILIPVIGFLIVGVMRKNPRILCLLTKAGWALLAGGLGGTLWSMLISMLLSDLTISEMVGPFCLVFMCAGLVIGYIGAKIDKARNGEYA